LLSQKKSGKEKATPVPLHPSLQRLIWGGLRNSTKQAIHTNGLFWDSNSARRLSHLTLDAQARHRGGKSKPSEVGICI
jgi:hypothetical protein